MKTLTIILCILFTAPCFAAHKKINIQHWISSRGVRVYFISAPEIPMVDIRVTFDAGSSRDENQPGLAFLTNNMLNEGADNLNADQIATKFDDVGATYNNDVQHDMTTLSLRSLTTPTSLKPALALFSSILTKPTFPLKDLERQKNQIKNALEQVQQSPNQLADENFYKTIYQEYPYSHPIIGTLASIPTLSQENLKQFYKKYYVTKNAVIAIVGALNQQQAKDIAEQITQFLPTGEAANTLTPAKSLTQAIVNNVSYPSAQTHIRIGTVGITPYDTDYFPLIVGNFILGGDELVSRLPELIREKNGLAYSIYSAFVPMPGRGPFLIALQTKSEHSQHAIQLVTEQLQQYLSQGPSQKELSYAQDSIVNNFNLILSSNTALAKTLSNIAFYHRPLDYLEKYPEKIKAVTLTQVRKAFQQHINSKTLAIVTVGQQTHATQ